MNHRCLLLDRFELIERARTAAGTNSTSIRPCIGRANIGIPERPCAALARPGSINAAFARLAVEENAIAVGVFDETFADADLAYISRFKFGNIDAHLGRQPGDVLLIDPHVTWRAGAAIAAARALELQAVLVPGLSFLVRHNTSIKS
jgi:hypothetical protein